MFVNKKIIYEEVFSKKIFKSKYILNIDYNEKDYNNIFENIYIIDKLKLKIDCINVEKNIIKNLKSNDKISFYIKDIEDINKKYDIIIFNNLFYQFNLSIINNKIEKAKSLLKSGGKIIFINNIITYHNQYTYHPFSYFFKCIYISDLYDILKENELIILDSNRILTLEIPTYPVEYFSIICENKFTC
jgi:hypothetical protein